MKKRNILPLTALSLLITTSSYTHENQRNIDPRDLDNETIVAIQEMIQNKILVTNWDKMEDIDEDKSDSIIRVLEKLDIIESKLSKLSSRCIGPSSK